MWCVVWAHLYFGGPKKQTLPVNNDLKKWSLITLLCIFLFYTTFYLPKSISVSILYSQLHEPWLFLAGVLILLGFGMIFVSRYAIRHLAAPEVFISISTEASDCWIYKYMSHPMYTGITSILIGSWMIVPNMLSIPLIMGAMYAMWQKSNIEKRALV